MISHLHPIDISPKPCPDLKQIENISLSPIEALPVELLDHIINYLPGFSVVSLQKCSKVLSFKVNPDQHFWRDELISGCIGVLFDLDKNLLLCKDKEPLGPGLEWDWKGLIAYFAHLQKNFLDDKLWDDQRTIKHFRNRCRVWRIAYEIEQLSTQLSREGKLNVPGPFIEGIPALSLDVKARV